jgi:hypothetical protein
MRVICKQTTSEGFDLKEVTTIFSNNHDYSAGGFGLELNREYIVMGMLLYKDTNCIYFLVDVNSRPEWYPYLLFDVSDNSIPNSWFTKIYDKKIKNNGVFCLWGFKELCNDETFYEQLIDRDDQAMRTYFKRKIEIEKSLEEI